MADLEFDILGRLRIEKGDAEGDLAKAANSLQEQADQTPITLNTEVDPPKTGGSRSRARRPAAEPIPALPGEHLSKPTTPATAAAVPSTADLEAKLAKWTAAFSAGQASLGRDHAALEELKSQGKTKEAAGVAGEIKDLSGRLNGLIDAITGLKEQLQAVSSSSTTGPAAVSRVVETAHAVQAAVPAPKPPPQARAEPVATEEGRVRRSAPAPQPIPFSTASYAHMRQRTKQGETREQFEQRRAAAKVQAMNEGRGRAYVAQAEAATAAAAAPQPATRSPMETVGRSLSELGEILARRATPAPELERMPDFVIKAYRLAAEAAAADAPIHDRLEDPRAGLLSDIGRRPGGRDVRQQPLRNKRGRQRERLFRAWERGISTAGYGDDQIEVLGTADEDGLPGQRASASEINLRRRYPHPRAAAEVGLGTRNVVLQTSNTARGLNEPERGGQRRRDKVPRFVSPAERGYSAANPPPNPPLPPSTMDQYGRTAGDEVPYPQGEFGRVLRAFEGREFEGYYTVTDDRGVINKGRPFRPKNQLAEHLKTFDPKGQPFDFEGKYYKPAGGRALAKKAGNSILEQISKETGISVDALRTGDTARGALPYSKLKRGPDESKSDWDARRNADKAREQRIAAETGESYQNLIDRLATAVPGAGIRNPTGFINAASGSALLPDRHPFFELGTQERSDLLDEAALNGYSRPRLQRMGLRRRHQNIAGSKRRAAENRERIGGLGPGGEFRETDIIDTGLARMSRDQTGGGVRTITERKSTLQNIDADTDLAEILNPEIAKIHAAYEAGETMPNIGALGQEGVTAPIEGQRFGRDVAGDPLTATLNRAQTARHRLGQLVQDFALESKLSAPQARSIRRDVATGRTGSLMLARKLDSPSGGLRLLLSGWMGKWSGDRGAEAQSTVASDSSQRPGRRIGRPERQSTPYDDELAKIGKLLTGTMDPQGAVEPGTPFEGSRDVAPDDNPEGDRYGSVKAKYTSRGTAPASGAERQALLERRLILWRLQQEAYGRVKDSMPEPTEGRSKKIRGVEETGNVVALAGVTQKDRIRSVLHAPQRLALNPLEEGEEGPTHLTAALTPGIPPRRFGEDRVLSGDEYVANAAAATSSGDTHLTASPFARRSIARKILRFARRAATPLNENNGVTTRSRDADALTARRATAQLRNLEGGGTGTGFVVPEVEPTFKAPRGFRGRTARDRRVREGSLMEDLEGWDDTPAEVRQEDPGPRPEPRRISAPRRAGGPRADGGGFHSTGPTWLVPTMEFKNTGTAEVPKWQNQSPVALGGSQSVVPVKVIGVAMVQLAGTQYAAPAGPAGKAPPTREETSYRERTAARKASEDVEASRGGRPVDSVYAVAAAYNASLPSGTSTEDRYEALKGLTGVSKNMAGEISGHTAEKKAADEADKTKKREDAAAVRATKKAADDAKKTADKAAADAAAKTAADKVIADTVRDFGPGSAAPLTPAALSKKIRAQARAAGATVGVSAADDASGLTAARIARASFVPPAPATDAEKLAAAKKREAESEARRVERKAERAAEVARITAQVRTANPTFTPQQVAEETVRAGAALPSKMDIKGREAREAAGVPSARDIAAQKREAEKIYLESQWTARRAAMPAGLDIKGQYSYLTTDFPDPRLAPGAPPVDLKGMPGPRAARETGWDVEKERIRLAGIERANAPTAMNTSRLALIAAANAARSARGEPALETATAPQPVADDGMSNADYRRGLMYDSRLAVQEAERANPVRAITTAGAAAVANLFAGSARRKRIFAYQESHTQLAEKEANLRDLETSQAAATAQQDIAGMNVPAFGAGMLPRLRQLAPQERELFYQSKRTIRQNEAETVRQREELAGPTGHPELGLRAKDKEAESKLTGKVDIAKGFVGLAVGGMAVGMIYGLVQKTVQAAIGDLGDAAGKAADELGGFTATAVRESAALAAAVKQNFGDAEQAVAGAAAPSGISAAGLGFLNQQGLSTHAGAIAASQAMVQRSDLFRAGKNISEDKTAGGFDKALFTGTGGWLGTSFMSPEPGYLERIAGTFKKNDKAAQAQASPGTAWKNVEDFADRGGVVSPGSGFGGSSAPEIVGPPTPITNTPGAIFNEKYAQTLNEDMEKVGATFKYVRVEADAFGTLLKKSYVDSAGLEGTGARNAAQAIADSGYALVNQAGNAVTGHEAGQATQAGAQGSLIVSQEVERAGDEKALRAQVMAALRESEDQLTRTIPRDRALANLVAPVTEEQVGAGIVGASPAEQKGIDAQLSKTKTMQVALNKEYQAGANILKEEMINAGAPPALLESIEKIGVRTAEIQAKIAAGQGKLQAHEYANQLRIAERSLSDIVGLMGKNKAHGASTLGILERETVMLSRQSELLGQMLQQRQINFQLAVAGFQVGGESGEERAARIKDAKTQAEFAQKQLDISKKQFGIGVKVFDITNDRSYTDAKKAIGLLTEGRALTISTAVYAEELKVLGKTQDDNLKKAGSYLTKVDKGVAIAFGEIYKMEAAYGIAIEKISTGTLSQFAADLEEMYAQINKYYNTASRDPRFAGYSLGGGESTKNASGFLGNVSGATSMIMGEAGTETVAILRNPREATLSGGGGGGVTININHPVVRNDQDINKITASVVRAINTRTALLGLR